MKDWLSLDRVRSTLDSFPVCEERHTDDCRIYNPGVVLPLILGALEDATGGLPSTSVGYTFECDGDEVVELTRHLCSSGGIALALGSLCSNSSRLRQTAIVILLMVRVILHSPTAREAASWRERPQIAMLLDSVHRGLAIRLSGLDNDGDEVPKVPGTSALFLARVVLILAKPNNDQFAESNRYFLRIEENGGAFVDFHRIPMFITLFCSSSEDRLQATRERLAALDFLRHTFIDEDCFKPLLACHAPEMLLSAYECVQDERELTALTETLIRILEKGGEKACLHLLSRLALLWWLYSSLSSSTRLDNIATDSGVISFSKLLQVATDKGKQVLPSSDFYASTRFLPQKLLDFFLNRVSAGQFSREAKESTMCAVIEVLCAIGGSSQEIRVDHGEGINPNDAINFLSSIPDMREKENVCCTVCRVPIYAQHEGNLRFCNDILCFAVTVQDPGDAFVTTVLSRVAFLIQNCKSGIPTTSFLEKVLSWRRSAIAKESFEAWENLIRVILRSPVFEKLSLEQVRKVLKAVTEREQCVTIEGLQK